MRDQDLTLLLDRLERIEGTLALLLQRQVVKDWYTTEEVARILGKSDFTVREWARLRRIHAAKQGSGRGKHQSWVIAHQELLRIQREGLIPLKHGA
jgi:excisionase family DNA binding protein